MQFHHQLTKHNPPESYGDCVRTCLACLLDKEPRDVPNLFKDVEDTQLAWERTEEWLRSEGYILFVLQIVGPIESYFQWIKEFNPNILHILLGNNHAVIACNGKILHDPSWTGIGVQNPTHVLLLMPISMRYEDA